MTEHIKMPDVKPVVRYTANGTQSEFSYPFPIFASEDLNVYLNGAQQISGFTVSGAGQTTGGSVTFDSAPAMDTIITFARELPIERLSDFLEGGDFSAQSINTELDYLVAALQQVNYENDAAMRYGEHETPGQTILPDRFTRKNKALGFNADGDPIAVSLEGAMAPPDFTAAGTGAVTRTSHDKFSDAISIKDFGAVGDGLTDDTQAIQKALAAHDSIYIPNGSYLISQTVAVKAAKTILGLGQDSIIKCQSNNFNAFEVRANNAMIANLRILGGDIAIRLFGADAECTQNSIRDVQMIGPNTGIQLDGYQNASYPCYWNHISNVLIEQFLTHGVHLTKSGAGDTPNANKFYDVRSYSKSAASTGSGFYIEHGAHANSFVDCEANVNGPTADSCFRVGAGSNKTLIMNLYTESTNTVPNLKLDSGSQETAIINLHSQSDGVAILDNSGGSYEALNAGFPDKNALSKTTVTDLKATLMRFDTEFIETPGTTQIDLSHSVHLVNTTNGAVTIELPAASVAEAAEITIKKVDFTGNIVTITENGGNGPDGNVLLLGGPNDYATVISNGAAWYIKSSNRMAGNTSYIDASGLVEINMAVDTYLLSSYGGAMTARLPPANATEAIGRTITLKKIDVSGNAVTVTEQGGNGPDQSAQTLAAQYNAITVVSNGANWFVVGKYP